MRAPHRFLLAAAFAAALFSTGCRRDEMVVSPPDVVASVQVDEHLRFSPSQVSCHPGQLVCIRISNTIPPQGPDLSHNCVLLKKDVDVGAFAEAAANAPAEHNFMPAAYASRVLAASPLVAPGKTFELSFIAPSAPGDYPIVCSFPGHCVLGMRGRLVVN